MSRTLSHGKNFTRKHPEAYKNRAAGYEYWSARPGNYNSCPGKISKRKTKRAERALNKIIEELEFIAFREYLEENYK